MCSALFATFDTLGCFSHKQTKDIMGEQTREKESVGSTSLQFFFFLLLSYLLPFKLTVTDLRSFIKWLEGQTERRLMLCQYFLNLSGSR